MDDSGSGPGIGIGRVAAAAGPTALGLLGAALMAIPVSPLDGLAPVPVLPLLVIFYWAINDPGLLRSPAVFLIGITQDLLLGGPLGVWAAVYLTALLAVRDQRDFFLGRDRTMMWIGAALVCAVGGVTLWMLMSILSAALMPPLPLVRQMAVTAIVYPVFARLFDVIEARIGQTE